MSDVSVPMDRRRADVLLKLFFWPVLKCASVLIANGQFREAEDPLILGGWAPPPEGEWAEMDPADMTETKLPTQGTLTFSATADPGPSGESFLDLVGCGRERPAGAVFLV